MAFRSATAGKPVNDWWSDGGLPGGTYCDVANGDPRDGACTGRTYTVNDARQVTLSVPPDGMAALHVGARTS